METMSEGLLAVGSEAPSFELYDQRGSKVRLADFDGRYLVLWWFVKASTPG